MDDKEKNEKSKSKENQQNEQKQAEEKISDMKQELEDYLEEQGIYIRQ